MYVLVGGYGNDLLYPVTTPPDGHDYVLGGPGDDILWLDAIDNLYFAGGDGRDSLHFCGAYLDLASESIDPQTPSSVEVIDLDDPQAQVVTLSAAVILDFSGGSAGGGALQIQNT